MKRGEKLRIKCKTENNLKINFSLAHPDNQLFIFQAKGLGKGANWGEQLPLTKTNKRKASWGARALI